MDDDDEEDEEKYDELLMLVLLLLLLLVLLVEILLQFRDELRFGFLDDDELEDLLSLFGLSLLWMTWFGFFFDFLRCLGPIKKTNKNNYNLDIFNLLVNLNNNKKKLAEIYIYLYK